MQAADPTTVATTCCTISCACFAALLLVCAWLNEHGQTIYQPYLEAAAFSSLACGGSLNISASASSREPPPSAANAATRTAHVHATWRVAIRCIGTVTTIAVGIIGTVAIAVCHWHGCATATAIAAVGEPACCLAAVGAAAWGALRRKIQEACNQVFL